MSYYIRGLGEHGGITLICGRCKVQMGHGHAPSCLRATEEERARVTDSAVNIPPAIPSPEAADDGVPEGWEPLGQWPGYRRKDGALRVWELGAARWQGGGRGEDGSFTSIGFPNHAGNPAASAVEAIRNLEAWAAAEPDWYAEARAMGWERNGSERWGCSAPSNRNGCCFHIPAPWKRGRSEGRCDICMHAEVEAKRKPVDPSRET